MRALWSQIEEAWRDTSIHQSEGGAFRSMTKLFGLEHPEAEIPEPDWRGAFVALAYGRRGTFDVTYEALQSTFRGLNYLVFGSVDSATPLVLTANDADAWGDGDEYVGRLVRVGTQLLFTTARNGADMTVARLGTIYWDAPVWEHTGVESFDFEVLPLVVHERQPGLVPGTELFSFGEECLFEIIIFATADQTIPVTYLLDPADYGTPGAEGDPPVDPGDVATPEGIPVRGQALEDETATGYPDGSGPMPLYAYDGNVFPATQRVMSSTLASSVEMRIVLNPPL